MSKGIYKRKNSGNAIEATGDIAKVFTNKGGIITIDTEDISKIKKYTWWIDAKGYAVTHLLDDAGKRYPLFMHRLIINAVRELEVDHINHRPSDNRKCNLRTCGRSENCANRRKGSNNTSGTKGVSWHRRKKQWQVRIMKDKKMHSLGYYNDLKEAQKARARADTVFFGEFACIS